MECIFCCEEIVIFFCFLFLYKICDFDNVNKYIRKFFKVRYLCVYLFLFINEMKG